MDQGRRGRPGRRRRADCHRSRAFLGSLPVEDAARALRPRHGARQRQTARRGCAVLRRADRGPHAQRAGVPAAGRSGTDLVDGSAARRDLLQHAPLLRRHGPLHARRRARLSRPCHPDGASESGRQGGPREDFDHRLRRAASVGRGRVRRARRPSWRSASRHPEDCGRSAADAGRRRPCGPRRHRAARSTAEGRYRKRRT